MSTQQQESDGAVVLTGIENWYLWLIYISRKIGCETYNSLMSDVPDKRLEKPALPRPHDFNPRETTVAGLSHEQRQGYHIAIQAYKIEYKVWKDEEKRLDKANDVIVSSISSAFKYLLPQGSEAIESMRAIRQEIEAQKPLFSRRFAEKYRELLGEINISSSEKFVLWVSKWKEHLQSGEYLGITIITTKEWLQDLGQTLAKKGVGPGEGERCIKAARDLAADPGNAALANKWTIVEVSSDLVYWAKLVLPKASANSAKISRGRAFRNKHKRKASSSPATEPRPKR